MGNERRQCSNDDEPKVSFDRFGCWSASFERQGVVQGTAQKAYKIEVFEGWPENIGVR